MFTGIVGAIGAIIESAQEGDLRIAVACPWEDLQTGESVAVNGACLTVTKGFRTQDSGFGFDADVSRETLARTARRWKAGDTVNLERALKIGERLSGHLVTGHVDGLAMLLTATPSGGSHMLAFEAPAPLARFIAEKGAVTLDGVSLTVNQVEGARFTVNIIPHTWQNTTLAERRAGDKVNLEVDLVARYTERLMHT